MRRWRSRLRASSNTNKPEFKVTNGGISGTSGVGYRFEVSKSADFGQIVAVVTVPVNGSGTTTMSLGELPYKTTYFWRVIGSDGAKESNVLEHAAVHDDGSPAPPRPPAAVAVSRRRANRSWRTRGTGWRRPARATARVSCRRWRARTRARCRTPARSQAAAGSSWIRSSTRCAPTTRAGATTASAATPTIRRRTSIAYHYGGGAG